MEKGAAEAPDDEPAAKAWNYVKVSATPATVKQPGQTALSVEKTVQAVKNIARNHFEGSALESRHCPEDLSSLGAERRGACGKNRHVPSDARRRAVMVCLYVARDNERLRSALKASTGRMSMSMKASTFHR